jgi:hypothetical protein
MVGGLRGLAMNRKKRNRPMNRSKKNQSMNHVVFNVSQKEIASCDKQIVQMAQAFGQGVEPMTASKRIRTRKPRKNGLVMARTLATLAVNHGLDGVVDVQDLVKMLDTLDQLVPIAANARDMSQTLDDKLLVGSGDAWRIAAKIYKVLRSLAPDDSQLAEHLAPIRASLKAVKRASPSSKKADASGGNAAEKPSASPEVAAPNGK